MKNEHPMTPKEYQTYLDAYNEGIVTGVELAGKILWETIKKDEIGKEDEDRIESLPQEVFDKLVHVVGKIKSNHFKWRVFFIGPGPNDEFDCEKQVVKVIDIINRRLEKDR